MIEEWQDRIIGTGTAAPGELKDNPGNWRVHGTVQTATMTDALKRIGWLQPILVNKRNGVVIDGHMRLAVAKKRGLTSVPVAYVDLDPHEEAAALATINPLGLMAALNELRAGEQREHLETNLATMRALLGMEPPEPDDEPDAGTEPASTRDGLTKDHTQTILDEEFDDEGELSLSYEDYDDNYSSESIRLISFVMTTDEYDRCLDGLSVICDREGMETNADAILWLFEAYTPQEATQ